MDADFWHRRWRKNEIAFHEGNGNLLLVRHFDELCGEQVGRVFLPLCGKTRDIGWLMSRGKHVAGSELSETAVEQLFKDLDVKPERSDLGKLTRYTADGIDIFVGDIFDLSADVLGSVDVVYDRAALIALPAAMRPRYAAHLMKLTNIAPQFLLTFEYDQNLMDGPPFSVTEEEIRRCYDERCDLKRIVSVDVAGGLKGKCAASENLWLLQASS